MSVVSLKSGRHRVAEGSIEEMVNVVKALRVVRNDDANWSSLELPWRVIENVLSASALDRGCDSKANGIDPFASLSVYDGNKKVISVWK
jgi:hypothetical protein|tara:strand:+ start:748 stop:1014 length:267 start_codon:yes stop_codon:yes gene_type:complete